jgi:hypothetical protein
MASEERWRPVPGWESGYEVSDLGRVRSKNRLIQFTDGRKRRYPGHLLSPGTVGRGYRSVTLCSGALHVSAYVHRLVYSAFKGSIPSDKELDHKDRDRGNNRASNLRLAEHPDNAANRISSGVRLCRRSKRWTSSIYRKGIFYNLGAYVTRKEARHVFESAQYLLLRRFSPTGMVNIHPRVYHYLRDRSKDRTKGVCSIEGRGTWMAYVDIDKGRYYLGTSFPTRDAAEKARGEFNALPRTVSSVRKIAARYHCYRTKAHPVVDGKRVRKIS